MDRETDGYQHWDIRLPLSLLSIPRTLGLPLVLTHPPAPQLCKRHLRLRVKGVKGWGLFPTHNTLGDSQAACFSDGPYRTPCPLSSHPILPAGWTSSQSVKRQLWDVNFLHGTTLCRVGAWAGPQPFIYKVTVIPTFP